MGGDLADPSCFAHRYFAFIREAPKISYAIMDVLQRADMRIVQDEAIHRE